MFYTVGIAEAWEPYCGRKITGEKFLAWNARPMAEAYLDATGGRELGFKVFGVEGVPWERTEAYNPTPRVHYRKFQAGTQIILVNLPDDEVPA
jgi:hypothetical protein